MWHRVNFVTRSRKTVLILLECKSKDTQTAQKIHKRQFVSKDTKYHSNLANTDTVRYLYLPHNLHFSCTFRLFFFPLSIIPIKFVKENYKRWYKVQMLIHPTCFQDAFWNVPLI